MCDIIKSMKLFLGKRITEFALSLGKPLYVVGGAVRNFLIDNSIAEDIDLAAAIPAEEFYTALNSFGFSVLAEYKRTGTVMFSDGERKYEYTAFRKESYVGGEHTPFATEFTLNLIEDACRRDFKCNAVYYDIAKDQIVDPLGGLNDIKNKILDTVISPDEVFCNDGLRLMRLARFSGELNFKPTEEVLISAEKYAENINAISPERVFSELNKILSADKKYPFSDRRGHYTALKILDRTKVLDKIMPELTEGRGMAQRADFHKYDVLEHSLRSALYAEEKVRLAALLHDVGKPFCMKRDGWYHYHYIEGVKISDRILKRLKADKGTIKKVGYLIKTHMVDLDCSMSEKKVRKFIVDNFNKYYDELLLVKQADYRASLEDEFVAPTLVKWEKIFSLMKKDGTPFTLKDLKITAEDLIDAGYSNNEIGKELKKLHDFAVSNPDKNDRKILIDLLKKDISKIKENKK